MTDEFDAMLAAMDAPGGHLDMALFAAAADFLIERGDARGEGLVVLLHLGKTGRPVDGIYPTPHAYNGGFGQWEETRHARSGTETTVHGHVRPVYVKTAIPVLAAYVVDPEWHFKTVPASPVWYRGMTAEEQERRDAEYEAECAKMCRVSNHRMKLAQAWADATESQRRRWAYNTAHLKDEVPAPSVEDALKWLASYAAALPTGGTVGEYDAETGDHVRIANPDPPCTLEELLARAEAYQTGSDYWNEGSRFDGFNNGEDFWSYYAVATGTAPKRRGQFFSCSC